MVIKTKELEDLGHFQYKLVVSYTDEEYQIAKKCTTEQISNSIRPPSGFRPGKKAHHLLVAKNHQDVIKVATRNYLIGDALQQLLQEKAWMLVSNPIFLDGQDFSYSAIFQIYPMLEQINTEDLSLIQPKLVLEPETIKENLKTDESTIDEKMLEAKKNEMEMESKPIIHHYMIDQLLDQLAEKNPISDLPAVLFEKNEEEISPFNLKDSEVQSFKTVNAKKISPEDWKKNCIEVILSNYIRLNKMEVDYHQFGQILQHLTSQYDDPNKAFMNMTKDQKMMKLVAHQVLKGQSFDILLKSAEKKEQNYLWQEILKLKKGG